SGRGAATGRAGSAAGATVSRATSSVSLVPLSFGKGGTPDVSRTSAEIVTFLSLKWSAACPSSPVEVLPQPGNGKGVGGCTLATGKALVRPEYSTSPLSAVNVKTTGTALPSFTSDTCATVTNFGTAQSAT